MLLHFCERIFPQWDRPLLLLFDLLLTAPPSLDQIDYSLNNPYYSTLQ